MKIIVKAVISCCVIFSAAAARADVTLIAKNETTSISEDAQDYHRYNERLAELNSDSDSIAAAIGRDRKPGSVSNTGTNDGYSVRLIKKHR